MMGASRRAQLCLAVLVAAVTHAAAQRDVFGIPGSRTVPGQGDGKLLTVGQHTYRIDEAVHPYAGEPYYPSETFRGMATQREPQGDPDYVEKEQMSSLGEDKLPPTQGDESASWSKEANLWSYREGEWREVILPDPAFPSLPTPDPPAPALVVAQIGKVEIQRSLEGLKNVALSCRFYLSDSAHPDTLPELEVHLMQESSQRRLDFEVTRGAWQELNIDVPETDNSTIVIEGWLKTEGDIIALTDLYITSVPPTRGEALDADSDQLTLTANTMENATSTLEAQDSWTEDADQANDTQSDDDTKFGNGTQPDASQSPAEKTTEEGTDGAVPTDGFEEEASTDIPENETITAEQANGSTDVVALNSSMADDGNMTSGGAVPSDATGNMTTTDAEDNEGVGAQNSTTATVTDGESGTPGDGSEDAGETTGKEDNTTLSIPGVTTESLQTNTTTQSQGNATATGDPVFPAETPVDTEAPSRPSFTTETPLTDGHNQSTTKFETDKGTSDTTPERPASNATLANVTAETVFPGGVITESTPPLAGNSTEAVVAVPVSSTSWQVFQIFLVLCVLGLLALGFLYWKRRRRQDDEIPVFSRHTDYPNPTFTMEDAANFMSRGGRNAYKTID